MKKNDLVLIPLLFLIFTFFSSTVKATGSDTLHVHDSASFAGFELIDSLVNDYDVFITGENHTFLDANSRLWVKMFKYLHQKAGVKNIMIEYGYASGWLINEYIQTGDTNLFNILKTYAYDQYAEAYKELMEYNQTLDSSDKIYLTGIDLERGVHSASKVLSMQFPEGKEPHDSIALHVESLKSLVIYNEIKVFDPKSNYSYFNSYSVRSTIDNIIENFDAHEAHYEEFIGENFALFKRILNGIKDLKVYLQYDRENSTHQFVYRERYMYKQFKKEYLEHEGKFFGQFGRCHISKNTQAENSCNWYNFKSLANRIKQNGIDTNRSVKVFTMGIFYRDGESDEDELEDVQDHLEELYDEMDDRRIALYDLPNDTVLHERLEEMFDYIVLCTYKTNREYGASVQEIEDILGSGTGAKIYVLLSGGIHQLDMTSLNNYFGLSASDGFSPNTPFWSITISSKEKRLGFQSLGYIGGYLKQELDLNDSMSARMKGFIYKSLSGYDVLKKQEWIDLVGGFGFSYHNLKLDIKRLTDAVTPSNGFVGEESVSRVKNPAILVDVFSSLEFNIKRLTVGGTIGYGWDLSQYNWRVDRRLLSEGPTTSLGGPFGSFNLGFNFTDDD